jgi:hypothetical protein
LKIWIKLIIEKELDVLDVLPLDSESLTHEMHSRGINMRYLGVIADMTKLPHVRDMVVVEMIARCCKKILRRTQRKVLQQCKNEPQESSIKLEKDPLKGVIRHELETVTVNFFNVILGSSRQGAQVRLSLKYYGLSSLLYWRFQWQLYRSLIRLR